MVNWLVSVKDSFNLPPEVQANLATQFALTANRPVNLYDIGADPTGSVGVAALLNATSGRQIDIPPGTYNVDDQIVVPANTTWNAERGVRFVGTSATFYRAMVKVTQPDVRINGRPILDANDVAYWGLYVTTGGDRFATNGLTITNTSHWGAYIENSADVNLDNFRLIGCGDGGHPLDRPGGMFIANCQRLRGNNLHAETSNQQGFYIGGYGGQDLQLSNITSFNNGGTGVDVRTPGATITNVIAQGNGTNSIGGGGFALNTSDSAAHNIDTHDTTLGNINCKNNLKDSEISLAGCTRVTAVGLSAYNDLVSGGGDYGVLIFQCSRVVLVGAQITGTNVNNVHVGGAVTDVEIIGAHMEQLRTGNSFNIQTDGTLDGFRVSNSVLKTAGTYNVRLTQSASNTDFRFGNTWNKALGSRINEYAGITGTGRLPVVGGAPAAFTDFVPDPVYPGLYVPNANAAPGNQIISDLRNAGFYA